MLEVDLHSHTLFSHCGIHTVIEMLTYAKKKGLKALAVTDHGPAVKEGRLNSPFFLRLKDPVDGIKLLKGAELNVISDQGDIDYPAEFLPYMDIVLVGLHQNIEKNLGTAKYTDLLVNAIIKNKFLDIITHPNNPEYLPDLKSIVQACKEYNKVIEINNSKTELKRVSDESVLELLSLCKEYKCLIAVNSDAHAVHEIGQDEAVKPLIKKTDFPEELIINRSLESALSFINSRKDNKRIYLD